MPSPLGTEISKITGKSLDVIYGIVHNENYRDFIKEYEEKIGGVI